MLTSTDCLFLPAGLLVEWWLLVERPKVNSRRPIVHITTSVEIRIEHIGAAEARIK